jgi:hypothetical protein
MSALHDTTDRIDDLALELLPLYSTCAALRTTYKPACVTARTNDSDSNLERMLYSEDTKLRRRR